MSHDTLLGSCLTITKEEVWLRTARVIIILLLLLGTAFFVEAQQTESIERDIMEAVLRYQFEHIGKSLFPDGSGVYFLSVKRGDPDDTLLRRFASHIPPVKKASESDRENGIVIDRETAKRGVVLFISRITIFNGNEAEVQGGYAEHGRSASENTYCLTKIDGCWIVTKDIQGRIS